MSSSPYGVAIRSMGEAEFSAWLTIESFIDNNPQHMPALVDALLLIAQNSQALSRARDKAQDEQFMFGMKGGRA